MEETIFEYSSAIRGYHYYRTYWQPKLEEELDCTHEKDNHFDYFAIKVTKRDTGEIVGHLPMENSRAIKYLINRGARIIVEPTSLKYYVSPLVQGGLEIMGRVKIFLPRTKKNKELVKIFQSLIEPNIYPRSEDYLAQGSCGQ